MIVATGLWVPLIALFVGRGLTMMWEALEPHLRRPFHVAPPRPDDAATPRPAESLLVALYLRIIIMQVTIILGAFVALLIGTVGAYVLLVALKTAVDLAIQACADAFHAALVKARAKAAAKTKA